MRKIVSFVVAIVIFVMLALGAYVSSADAVEHSCTVTALGDSPNLTVSCVTATGEPVPPSEIDVQGIVGDTVTVVIPEVREVVKTVVTEVPGPVRRIVRTVTVRPDPIIRTDTVRVPGPTQTVTNRVPAPGPTVYRTRDVGVPGPTETVTLARFWRQVARPDRAAGRDRGPARRPRPAPSPL